MSWRINQVCAPAQGSAQSHMRRTLLERRRIVVQHGYLIESGSRLCTNTFIIWLKHECFCITGAFILSCDCWSACPFGLWSSAGACHAQLPGEPIKHAR
jgi:hypothetical protein